MTRSDPTPDPERRTLRFARFVVRWRAAFALLLALATGFFAWPIANAVMTALDRPLQALVDYFSEEGRHIRQHGHPPAFQHQLAQSGHVIRCIQRLHDFGQRRFAMGQDDGGIVQHDAQAGHRISIASQLYVGYPSQRVFKLPHASCVSFKSGLVIHRHPLSQGDDNGDDLLTVQFHRPPIGPVRAGLKANKAVAGRLRPKDVMVGHTGYLIFARNYTE